MTYVDRRGRGWAIDPDGCAHVYRSNFYNRELVRRSRFVQRSQGFLLPTTTEIETNFDDIRGATTRAASVSVSQVASDTANDVQNLYEHLVRVREDGESAGVHYRNMMREATRQTARAIESNVGGWENALAVAKFVRDASAGALLVGASVLSGGAALGVGAAGTGLTFTGNTQDNLAANQTMRQAMGNAAISTSISVVTSVLIPRGVGAVGRGMVAPGAQLTMGQNVVLGLITVQANLAGDMLKTALTADANMPPDARAQFQRQMTAQVGARTATEMASMLFGAWLQSRGLPAGATMEIREGLGNMRDSISGGALSALGDRIVAQMSSQDASASAGRALDLAFTQLRGVYEAESYVREVAMRPL
ncbi:MAG: hypothetical protein KGL91_03830 [Xanthomonadaceae bacterium]|nr:hypothetical protein [Xanthomonadaceae bacterium]